MIFIHSNRYLLDKGVRLNFKKISKFLKWIFIKKQC
jgi:hypothetical protein